jgi:hypothetical protein
LLHLFFHSKLVLSTSSITFIRSDGNTLQAPLTQQQLTGCYIEVLVS